MARFRRGLTSAAMTQLERLTASREDNWWKHLLAAWTPSGQDSCSRGLRLAVRENYLSFYRLGNSVARIAFDRHSTPRLELHIKYVRPDIVDTVKRLRRCARVDLHGHITWWDANVGKYNDDQTLLRWTQNAQRFALGQNRQTKKETPGSDREKPEVDRIVRDTSDLIDLEMAWTPDLEPQPPTPVKKTKKGAPRLDIVCLETTGDEFRVVLWEAKRIADGRVRAAMDQMPEVFDQLKKYKKFLEQNDSRDQIVEAYRNTCEVLTNIHEMRSQRCAPPSETILAIGKNRRRLTTVDPMPRVVIFGDASGNDDPWLSHSARFTRQGYTLKNFILGSQYKLC